MKNLTAQELIEISGGAVQGSGIAGFGIFLAASADSLLSITLARTYGSYQSSTTLSIGKGINLGLDLSGLKQ